MVTKFFKKNILRVSYILNRIHIFIKWHLEEKSLLNKLSFSPYILKYAPSINTPRIVHVNGNFVVGGTSQLIVDIIENTSNSYRHEIIVPYYPDPLPYQPININKYIIDDFKKLYAFLESDPPALVHIHYWIRYSDRHDYISLWYNGIFKMCEELGIKVIQNVNVPTSPYNSPAVVHNVFVSKFVLEKFNNVYTNSSVIYPGSNFNHFRNDDISSLPNNVIGMVYRLDQDKLNAESIEVFIQVAKKRSNILCYIIGDGHYYNHYMQRVMEEKLENNFIFTGVVSYKLLPDYYKKMSLFVAPVHDESFGQVTPFAMSMGLCVAGYDTGALNEILRYDQTLVQTNDYHKLSEVIIELIDNPEKRAELGRINQNTAHDNFSVEAMIDDYAKLYELYIN